MFYMRGLPIDLTEHFMTLYKTEFTSNHTNSVGSKTLNYERGKTKIPDKTSRSKQK